MQFRGPRPMAYPYTREDYDDARPLYAVRSFVCGGVSFSPGDLFDRKKLGVPLHTAHTMWSGRLIDHHCLSAPAVQRSDSSVVAPNPPAAADSAEPPRKRREGARQ